MDLGSWRSNRGDVAQAVASPIVARNHPVSRRSYSERQRGDDGGTQSAAGHACRHQRTCLLTVWQRGFLVRTAWRIVAHHRHGGSRHHAGSRGRGSKRPNSKAHDRKNREQAMEQRPDLHALMISQFPPPGKVYPFTPSSRSFSRVLDPFAPGVALGEAPTHGVTISQGKNRRNLRRIRPHPRFRS